MARFDLGVVGWVAATALCFACSDDSKGGNGVPGQAGAAGLGGTSGEVGRGGATAGDGQAGMVAAGSGGTDAGGSGGAGAGGAAGSAGASGSGNIGPQPGFEPNVMSFSAFCEGTLLEPHQATEPGGGGFGIDFSSAPTFPVGTKFLLGTHTTVSGKSIWQGFVISPEGELNGLYTPGFDGLKKDVDFSTSCATKTTFDILLLTATFFDNSDLEGEGCTLQAGTVLTAGASVGPYNTYVIDDQTTKKKCGFAKAYSALAPTGALFLR